MAKRNINPIYFGDISYNPANVNKRWYLDAFKTGSVAFAGDDVEKASVINKIFAAGITGAVTTQSPNSLVLSSSDGAANAPVIIAVRVPQTKRLMTALLQGLVLPTGGSYSIFVSGRSDKKYTEIIDWVKVAGSEESRLESDADGWIPDATKFSLLSTETGGLTIDDKGYMGSDGSNLSIFDGSNYVDLDVQPTNVQMTHARFFPYMSAWVKLEFYDVGSNDLSIARAFFQDFVEDNQTAVEVAPEAEMVYPLDGKDWLPSQTVYATARIKEVNADVCHFGFEIYKESVTPVANQTWNGAHEFGVSGGDHLVFQIESNALNLDGTPNENYSRSWHPLGVLGASANNSVRLPGNPGNPRAMLIVPLEGVNAGVTGSFSNIKFYKNAGNQLLLDVVNDAAKLVRPVTFADITLPIGTDGRVDSEKRKTATGWVIELNAANVIQGFDRIDFIASTTAGKQVTKVEVYYVDGDISDIVSGKDEVEVDVDGVTRWLPDTYTSYQAEPWVANIEFCFPATTNYTSGYKEGSLSELQNEANNEFNPANNGKGFDQTNAGDWPKVPKYSGIKLGSKEDSLVYGDSPVPLGDATASLSSVALTNLDKSVYVRAALPDPYADGERYHVRAYVWDGRTKVIV